MHNFIQSSETKSFPGTYPAASVFPVLENGGGQYSFSESENGLRGEKIMDKKSRKGRSLVHWLLWGGSISLLMILPSLPAWAAEEPFPDRPITIIVSMAPGGVMDTHAQILGERLGKVLGQPLLRLHKPGAGGRLAASFAARAKADGYSLFTGTSSNLIIPVALKKVDYTWEDFIPLGIYCKGIIHFYVKKDAPWKTLADLVADAKNRQIRAGTFGKNTTSDFVLEAFNKEAGIKLINVPYKSCAETVTALLGGNIDVDLCSSSMGQMAAGAVRILAVSDYERTKYLPEIKTLKECGYPVVLPMWYSLCVQKDTPPKVLDILTRAMQEVYKNYGKQIEEELMRVDAYAHFLNSQQSIQAFRQDYEVTLKLVKELGAQE
jgi:tripartite-type tricarboxylate transporter receptor subunit TctC